jgi:hypothetical protein
VAPGAIGEITQIALDGVLGNYADRTYRSQKGMASPVQHATILWWDGDNTATELSDAEIAERMRFAQLLVFSALAERRFGGHAGYWSSDGIAVVGQRVDLARPALVSVTTRRRDGHGMNVMGGDPDVPLFLRPTHVPDRLHIEVDTRLLKAPATGLDYRLQPCEYRLQRCPGRG